MDWAAADMDLGTKSPLLCGPDKGMLLVAEITSITISHISNRERDSASQPDTEREKKCVCERERGRERERERVRERERERERELECV